MAALVEHIHLRKIRVRLAVALAANRKVVQVRIVPAHRSLDDVVKLGQ
jgi:hypothetical protein